MSDPKQQDLASIDHGPSGLREPGNDPVPLSVVRAGNQDWPAQRKLDETVAYLRARAGRDPRTQKQPDIFAEAVAKVMQEQREPELFEAPSVLQNQALGIVARFAVATGLAALVALVFVVAFPASQGSIGEGALSALPTWQSLTSSLFPPPQRKPAPSLVVRDGFSAKPGDRMWLRPSHVDPTVNLHDRLYAFRGDEVEEVWPVSGRGYR